MSVENEKKILKNLEESVMTVLKEFPVAVLSLEKNEKWLERWPNKIFSSVLGFDSDAIKGNLNFCCDRDFLVATVPGIDENQSAAEQEEQLRDWLGEVTNLIAGQLSRAIQAYGVKFKINPPSVFLANIEILDRYEEISPCHYVWFSLNNVKFCLQLGLVIEEGFQLQSKSRLAGPRPGEVIQLKSLATPSMGMTPQPRAHAPQESVDAAPSHRSTSGGSGPSDASVSINWTQDGVQLNLNGIKLEIVLNDSRLKHQVDEFQMGGHKFRVSRGKDQVELRIDDLNFIFPTNRVA
jgi:CheY-specific phosphatase CheX